MNRSDFDSGRTVANAESMNRMNVRHATSDRFIVLEGNVTVERKHAFVSRILNLISGPSPRKRQVPTRGALPLGFFGTF